MRNRALLILLLWSLTLSLLPVALRAQAVLDIIRQNPSYGASNYCVYPEAIDCTLTPAPAGKRPFYISHYGRHGSRYINDRKGFDIPYNMLCHADSMGELTPAGRKVLERVRLIIKDSDKRWGDLTGFGGQQLRNIAHRMVTRFPEVFSDSAHIDARSTLVNRCMLSMGTALQEMAIMNNRLQIDMNARKRDMWYLNHQDQLLRHSRMSPEAQRALDAYTATRGKNQRLMELLFVNPDSVRKVVDEEWLNFYMIKIGLFQMNTDNDMGKMLADLFEPDDIYRLWQKENAWWYIQHGATPLNGGHQPYSQRFLLRKIIQDADSCLQLEKPGVQLRFGHETVLLPLVCLLGVNGYDLEVSDLEQLEVRGWWGSSVFPMGANLQLIFYRSDKDDPDVLFKVLLNEREATLPLKTDCAPYYHWQDFRTYYLEKLRRYDEVRKELRNESGFLLRPDAGK